MAKIPYAVMPTKDDLGIVGINPTTKVIRQDVSHIGSGMKAIGAATKEVGQAMADYAEKKGIYEESEAETNFYIKRNELRERAEKEPYSEDMAERYSEEEVKASQEYAEKISHPAIRNRFVANSRQKSAESKAWLNDLSNKKRNERDLGETSAKLNQLKDILLANGDVTKIGETLDTGYKRIEGLVGQRAITQEESVVMKRQWASDIGVAMVGKVSPKVAAKILDEQESLAKEGKNYIPVTEIDRLRKDTSERNLDEFSVNYVDKVYKGSLGGGMRAIKNDKSLTAEQRIAAERRLSSIHSLAEADKALRERSAFSHYVSSAAKGVNYSQWAKDNPGTDSALNPSTRLSLIRTAQSEGKQPKTTPDQVLTDLSSMYQRAQETGNYAPFHKAVDDNLPYMSKEDQTKYLNIRKDLTVPRSEERRLKHQSLLDAQTSGMSKANKAKMRLELERFEDRKIQEKGRLPTDDEVRVEFFAPAMLEVDKPMSWSDVKVYEGVEDDPDRIENAYFLTRRAREMDVDLDEEQLLESLVDLKRMREQAENEAYQFLQERRIDPKKNQMLYNKSVETKWKKLRDI